MHRKEINCLYPTMIKSKTEINSLLDSHITYWYYFSGLDCFRALYNPSLCNIIYLYLDPNYPQGNGCLYKTYLTNNQIAKKLHYIDFYGRATNFCGKGKDLPQLQAYIRTYKHFLYNS